MNLGFTARNKLHDILRASPDEINRNFDRLYQDVRRLANTLDEYLIPVSEIDADGTRDSTTFLRGDGTWATPVVASSEWDDDATQAADQDVTNNSSTQASDLSIAVLTGELWYFQYFVLYSGNNTTGDYKFNITFPASSGVIRYVASHGTGDAVLSAQAQIVPASTALPATVGLGTDAAFTARHLFMELMLQVAGDGNVVYQFSNNSAALGRTSRTHAGSFVRGKKIISV